MTITNWSNSVNTKFFAYNNQPKENSVITENLSGRTVGYNVNTRNVMKIKCSIRLTVRTELPEFWRWYTTDLGGLSGAFTCTALGNKNYRFTSVPSPEDTDLQYRVLNLEIEEVY